MRQKPIKREWPLLTIRLQIVYSVVIEIMKVSEHGLQDIILGHEQTGPASQLKTTQSFLRRHGKAGSLAEKQQYIENKEATALLTR
jgi:hypothetical protein